VANGRDDRDLRARYARARAVIIVVVLIGIGAALSDIGVVLEVSKEVDSYAKSIGSAILASVIVYILISWLLEPVRQRAQAADVSRFAIEVANRQFQERFEASLPTATYEASAIPKPKFQEAFVPMLVLSTRYDYKGDSANFTSFRLYTLSDKDEVRRLEIRICVIDPRAEEPLRAHAEHRLARKRQIPTAGILEKEINQIREDVYVSMVALFDIRHAVATNLYFHRDLPFFRCEMFDDSMFLTYYLGSAAYPETLHFVRNTRPYMAYNKSLELTRRFAWEAIYFSSVGPSADLVSTEEKLVERLRILGCQADPEALREKMDDRFETLRRELGSGGVSPQGLF
jgi:hypothetical protein